MKFANTIKRFFNKKDHDVNCDQELIQTLAEAFQPLGVMEIALKREDDNKLRCRVVATHYRGQDACENKIMLMYYLRQNAPELSEQHRFYFDPVIAC